MKWLRRFLKIVFVASLAQSCIVFFNVKAQVQTNTIYTNTKYQTQVQIPTKYTSFFTIPKVEPKENKKKLYDNEHKIFDKDINIPQNRIEYENIKEFLIEKKASLIKFDSLKFNNLSKTTILTYRKQIENTKSLEGIIQFEKIIKTAKDNDANEFYFKLAEYGYLGVGALLGWLLFTFYTKKFIYRMEYIEEIPNNSLDEVAIEKRDEFLTNQNLVAQTQVLPVVDFEDESIAQTLMIAQQDYIEENKEISLDDENTWLISSQNKGDKK